MPPLTQDLTGLAVALGIGLLVGIERERALATASVRAPAGLRTFALVGILGALAWMIGPYGILVAGSFVALAAIAGYLRTRGADPGMTTEVAMLVTFALGVLAMRDAALAGGMGVVVALVLAGKARMHRLTREILTAQELHDLLLLVAAAFVVLPLLPDRAIDPWGALNPHRVWLLVVAVMGVSSAAYVGLRALGARLGLALAGLAGGFVSGTATIAAMGDGARAHPEVAGAYACAALLANVATIVLMVVVLATLSPELLRSAAWPLAAAGFVAVSAAVLVGLRARASDGSGGAVTLKRPFEPMRAIGFVAIVAVIMLFAALMRATLGTGSLPWVLAASGFADVHAAGASAAQLVAAHQVGVGPARIALLAAMCANSLGKCVVAVARGGRAYALRVVPGIALMMVAFGIAMAATRAS